MLVVKRWAATVQHPSLAKLLAELVDFPIVLGATIKPPYILSKLLLASVAMHGCPAGIARPAGSG
jgi:hypothetical protein